MADQFSKKLGARIRELRLQANLTQERFGDLVGKTPVAISGIENGHTMPSVATLRVFARKLGVRVSDLFDFESKPQGSASAKLNAKIGILRKGELETVDLVVDALLTKRTKK